MYISQKPKGHVYSFRATDELEDAIEKHFAFLIERASPGVTVRRTDALASLVAVGFMAWSASYRAAQYSPGAIIDMGERAIRDLDQSENDHE